MPSSPLSSGLGMALIGLAKNLYSNFNNNPFYEAYENAKISGYFIADLIVNNFEGHFINLVGFSMGT